MRTEVTSSALKTHTTIGIPSPFSTNGHEVSIANNSAPLPPISLDGYSQPLPFQPCFPEWDTVYKEPVEQKESFQVNSRVRTHKEEKQQPYLLPVSVVEDSHELLADMQCALSDWNTRDNIGAFEKLRRFSDLRVLYSGIPAYVRAEDDPSLRMPNPFMGDIMGAYGELHKAGKEDVIIRRLLEQEARKYERHFAPQNQPKKDNIAQSGSLKNRIGESVRGVISFLR